MVTAEHVRAIVDTLRELAEDGRRGTPARARIVGAALPLSSTCPTSELELAHALLDAELIPWAGELLAEVQRLECDTPDGDADGLLWLDAALIRVLAKLDMTEATNARESRAAKADNKALRWELWAETQTPLGLVRFASVLWSRRVADLWRRGVESPAAIVRAIVHDRLLPLGRQCSLDETSGELKDSKGKPIARLEVAAVDLAIMRRGLAVFRSTLAHKLVRFFSHEAHRAELRGVHRPEIVLIEGGLVGLAESIGCNPKKECDRLRDLLAIGRALDLSTPGLDVHGLWHWNTLKKAAPGQRAVLEIILNHRIFLKGSATDLKAMGINSREAQRARRLVPVTRNDPPHRIPNRAEWGRAWSVADAVLLVLVDAAGDLAREGSTRIDSNAWQRLVTEAGLDSSRVARVRDVLIDGDGVSPPLLARVSPDRFTLAPCHGAELAFIMARCSEKKT